MRLPEGASTDYRTPLRVVHPPDSEAKSLTRSGRSASGDANYWILNTGYPLGPSALNNGHLSSGTRSSFVFRHNQHSALRTRRPALSTPYPERRAQSRIPRTQLRFIICGDGAKHQRGVHCRWSTMGWRVLRSTVAVFHWSRSLKSDRSQLSSQLLGCARVWDPHDEQFGVLLAPKPHSLGDRVR